MTEFEVLGTDQELDPVGDPTGTAMSVVYLILGAAVLFMILPIGRQLGNSINDSLAEAVGMDVGDSNAGITFGDG